MNKQYEFKADIIGSALDELAEELLSYEEPIFVDSLYTHLFGDRSLSNKSVEILFEDCCTYLESQGVEILYDYEEFEDRWSEEETLLDSSSLPNGEEFEE